jgi:signal transduction histidine kinase
LETMLIQLLDNCLKFKASDRELIITVTYQLKNVKGSEFFWDYLRSEQYHQVSITDNGIGFDKDYNEKIFGLFQRLHSNSEYIGRGIGLSIARRVMLNHKGHISASGEKNIGASFILLFPAV